MYDLVIKNGKLIDGTGSPAYRADLAISNGKIMRIARGITDGKKVIDAAGLVVTPGFIDSHSHSDADILRHPDLKEKVEQGITTIIAGQCGVSVAPVSREIDPQTAEEIDSFGKVTDVFKTMGTFLEIAKNVPQGANTAIFVGHSALRRAVIGSANREPTPQELEQMKALLREGIENGALGISFGLVYAPSCYGKTDELIELAKVAGEYNALVAAHVRNEGDTLVSATEEFITILRESGARGIHSHHKAMYKANWGKVSHTLRMLDEANEQGIEVYCDTYPYCASSTALIARFFPKELLSEGRVKAAQRLSDPELRKELKKRNIEMFGEDLSWVLVPVCDLFPDHPGKRIPELAALSGRDPYDTVFDIIQKQHSCHATFFTACEEDLETVLAHPRTMICTDAAVAGKSVNYHPRLRASFPRALGRYVRERKVTSLPEMIRKMTSMPAAVYGLKGKGILAEGFDADICIFDPNTIADRADYINCTEKAEGLNYVLVNGQVVVEDAVFNGKCMGKLLLRRR